MIFPQIHPFLGMMPLYLGRVAMSQRLAASEMPYSIYKTTIAG